MATSQFTKAQWEQKVVVHLEAAETALAEIGQDYVVKGEIARAHSWQAQAIGKALEMKVI
jgi:hypothetical protein